MHARAYACVTARAYACVTARAYVYTHACVTARAYTHAYAHVSGQALSKLKEDATDTQEAWDDIRFVCSRVEPLEHTRWRLDHTPILTHPHIHTHDTCMRVIFGGRRRQGRLNPKP
jgi:hypothetical protein